MLPPALTGLKLTEKDAAAVEQHRLLIGAFAARIKDKRHRPNPKWEAEVWGFQFPDGPFEDPYENKELASTVARQLGALQVCFDLHFCLNSEFREQVAGHEKRGEIFESMVLARCPPVSLASPNWVFDAKIFQFRRPKLGEEPGVAFGDILELWLQTVKTRHLVYEMVQVPAGGGTYRDVKTSRYVNTRTFRAGPGMINVP